MRVRPWSARTRARVALLVAGTLVLVSACGSSRAPSSAILRDPIGATIASVSIGQVQHDINALYAADRGIRTYEVNDVTYSAATRDKVLSVCQNGAFSGDEEALQSSRVSACAPLIYFFYSYGQGHASSKAAAVANAVYDYAVTNISGPLDTQTTLDALLQSWGVPVARPRAHPVHLPLAQALIASARTAMAKTAGVHITVTTRSSSGTKLLSGVFDCGRSAAVEALDAGAARGKLVVSSASAYFSGDPQGLARFFGMSATEARRIGAAWVSVPAATSQYASLAPSALVGSLASAILPTTEDVTVKRVVADGHPAYQLQWTGANDAGSPTTDRLILAASAGHLPISSQIGSPQQVQSTTYTSWGERVAASVPSHALSFAQVAG